MMLIVFIWLQVPSECIKTEEYKYFLGQITLKSIYRKSMSTITVKKAGNGKTHHIPMDDTTTINDIIAKVA